MNIGDIVILVVFIGLGVFALSILLVAFVQAVMLVMDPPEW